ncbi:hypothetical protein Ddye_023675, partial [Dipteronia dyeriana]
MATSAWSKCSYSTQKNHRKVKTCSNPASTVIQLQPFKSSCKRRILVLKGKNGSEKSKMQVDWFMQRSRKIEWEWFHWQEDGKYLQLTVLKDKKKIPFDMYKVEAI